MKRIAGIIGAVALIAALPAAAGATMLSPNAEIRPFVGGLFPTGTLGNELSSSFLAGAQLGYKLPIPLHLVGTFAWTPSRAKDLADKRTNIFLYDAGVTYTPYRSTAVTGWSIRPFIGAGLGARTYSFSSTGPSDQTDFDAYGAIGGELTASRIGARLELRDYASHLKGLDPLQEKATRNDLMLQGAVTFQL